jgi:HNH endonuclease
MRIKSFQKFNEELQRIKSRESSTGRTKEYDIILDEPSSDLSASSGVLLRKKFRDMEDEETLKRLHKVGNMTSAEKKLYYRNKSKGGQNLHALEITFNNLQFLKDRQKEIGELRCEYCGKGPLKIYDINPNELKASDIRNKRFRFNNVDFDPKNAATADHKHPISKGGDKFDYNNLAVCCHKCNSNKSNMSWEDWVKRMSLKESSEN